MSPTSPITGMQDGKVFDFISRTTPTAGKDQNFIGQILAGATGAPQSLPGATQTIIDRDRRRRFHRAAGSSEVQAPPRSGRSIPTAARSKARGIAPAGLFGSDGRRGSAVREHGQQQQRHDVGDLDRRVDGRAGGILVGVADRVAGHRGLVRLGPL